MHNIATNPINEPNVIYCYYDHFSYDNTYPPSWEPAKIAYWNGNLANAKALLYDHWLNQDHTQEILNKRGISPYVIAGSAR